MPNLIDDLSALTQDDVERIERVTMRWLFQAVVDFGREPVTIFANSSDAPKDVAEDVTREVLDRLTGYNIQQRVFGNVDYKKARYIVLPDQVVRQALFVDSYDKDSSGHYILHRATLCAIPNGRLQGRYNPTASDTIWLTGPHAPKRGEEFRVRLGFKRLQKKAAWRVQLVMYDGGAPAAIWRE